MRKSYEWASILEKEVSNVMTEDLCVFCKIVQKKAPASIVYEDDAVMAFLDIRPLNEGHTLVVPKGIMRLFTKFQRRKLPTYIKLLRRSL